MPNWNLLALLALLAAAGCSSNKSDSRPEPSVQGSLDSAANRVARDTADSSANR
jgi:hypothetical protein